MNALASPTPRGYAYWRMLVSALFEISRREHRI
jgi:hypothetical protein